MSNTNSAGIRVCQDRTSELTVQLEGETFWLNQEQVTPLFGREHSVITKHLCHGFAGDELEQDVGCAEAAQPAADRSTC